MLLAVDVSNSYIKLGVFDGDTLRRDFRISTDRRKTAEEYGLLFLNLLGLSGLTAADVTAVAVASVVPPLNPTLRETFTQYLHREPLMVGPGTKTGMVIRTDNPREVGADRIASAVGAYEKYGGPLIVVDMGTATKMNCVSASGEFLGGVICPGMGISADALFSHAAKLSRVELVKPQAVLGRNTVAAMQAGIIYGHVGLVDELCNRLRDEMGGTARVIATGGFAELVAPESRTIETVDRLLTLEGIRRIWLRNR
jgi:type III pantothenate kinase